MKSIFSHPCKTLPARAAGHRQRGKGQTIARLIGICITAALFHLPGSANAAAKSPAQPAGHYCGQLLSSGRLVDVETSLQVDARGHLSGTYRFDDDGNTTAGTLSEVGKTPGTVRTLRWFDRYGMGSLTIRFEAGYRRFEGLWGPQNATPSYTWNGGSCGTPIS